MCGKGCSIPGWHIQVLNYCCSEKSGFGCSSVLMSNLKLSHWKRVTLLNVLSPILICNGHGEQIITFLFVITFIPFKDWDPLSRQLYFPHLNKPSSVNLSWEMIFSLIVSVSILWAGSDYSAPFLICLKCLKSDTVLQPICLPCKFAINRQQ